MYHLPQVTCLCIYIYLYIHNFHDTYDIWCMAVMSGISLVLSIYFLQSKLPLCAEVELVLKSWTTCSAANSQRVLSLKTPVDGRS